MESNPSNPEPAIEVSLVMPCLNEAETLEKCLVKAKQGLEAARVAGEIIVADNGSRDGSQAIAQGHQARVIDVKRRGYGAALRAGIEAARGSYVIMADSDDSYDWSTLQPFIDELRKGTQLVMGTRLRGTILPGAMPALHRWLGNPVLTFLGNVLFRSRVSDYHCGMRAFDRDAILALGLHTTGMEFATEMVAKAAQNKLSISEVKINYYPDGRSRRPHLRTWHDGWRHLTFMLLLSPTWVFVYPAVLFLVIGIVGNILLLPGPRYIGSVGLDVHSLLISNILLIMGVDALTMGAVARIFAYNSRILNSAGGFEWVTKNNSLSLGLLLGLVLIVVGLLPVLAAFDIWAATRFGGLNYQVILRYLIPGLTLMVIGLHCFFGSFVIALLSFQRHWS